MAILEIALEDLQAFDPDISEAKAAIMVKDAIARAKQLAPFLASDDLDQPSADAASGVIRRAVLRWNDAGTGAITQESQSAGNFSQSKSIDNRETSKVLFFPSEVDELRALGPVKPRKGKAFSIDMASEAYVAQPNLWG
ncbi:hypothetical protein ACFY5D_16685 [Paeniglutamicibacter sp. NPDC012692]|uniref:hypothetical protein n=1 Tax=Paeniglutamicibacter sp. NPDC012692 TaxID=3364388 RepID=UPI00367DDD93